MTHFRFLVPTLPLKIALLVWISARCSLNHIALSIGTPALVLTSAILMPQQDGSNPNYTHAATDPKPLSLEGIKQGTAWSDLQSLLINANPPHSRDENDLKPFINTLVAQYGSLSIKGMCVATYQAGYFPWMLRQHFSPSEIYIVDTAGLNNRSMAFRKGPRNATGLEDSLRIDLLIQNENRDLISSCHGKLPDMVYVFRTSDEEAKNYTSAGYSLAWRRPEAVVFMKNEMFNLWKARLPLDTPLQ